MKTESRLFVVVFFLSLTLLLGCFFAGRVLISVPFTRGFLGGAGIMLAAAVVVWMIQSASVKPTSGRVHDRW